MSFKEAVAVARDGAALRLLEVDLRQHRAESSGPEEEEGVLDQGAGLARVQKQRVRVKTGANFPYKYHQLAVLIVLKRSSSNSSGLGFIKSNL